MKWGLKGGISIDIDSGPLGYKCFDAVVGEVKTFYFYSDWLWPYFVFTIYMVHIVAKIFLKSNLNFYSQKITQPIFREVIF